MCRCDQSGSHLARLRRRALPVYRERETDAGLAREHVVRVSEALTGAGSAGGDPNV